MASNKSRIPVLVSHPKIGPDLSAARLNLPMKMKTNMEISSKSNAKLQNLAVAQSLESSKFSRTKLEWKNKESKKLKSNDSQNKFVSKNVKSIKQKSGKVAVNHKLDKFSTGSAKVQLRKKSPHKHEIQQNGNPKSVHSVEKENKMSSKKQQVLDQKVIKFEADEYYRSLILSGRELSSSVIKNPPGSKLSSVVSERPSIYNINKVEISEDPYKDALKALENISVQSHPKTSELTPNSKSFVSPFKVERPLHKKTELLKNPYKEALEAIQNLSAKKKDTKFEADEFYRSFILSGRELSSSTVKNSTGSKLSFASERPSIYRTVEISKDPYKDALEALDNAYAQNKCNSKTSDFMLNSKPYASPFKIQPTKIKSSSGVNKDLKKFEGQHSSKNAKKSKKVTFNLEIETFPSVLHEPKDKEFSDNNNKALLSADILEEKKEPSFSANEDKNNLPISPQSSVNLQDVKKSANGKEDKMESEFVDCKLNEGIYNSIDKESLASHNDVIREKLNQLSLNVLHRESDDSSISVIHSEDIVRKYSAVCGVQTSLPNLMKTVSSVETSNNESGVDKKLIDIVHTDCDVGVVKIHSPNKTTTVNSDDNFSNLTTVDNITNTARKLFSEQSNTDCNYLYCVPRKLNKYEDSKYCQQKIVTPCPISFSLQSKSSHDGSPEFLTERSGKLTLTNVPIHTPLILKSMSRNLEALSPVQTKLDFTNFDETFEDYSQKNENPRRLSIFSAVLQGLPTKSGLLDELADQECGLLLLNQTSPLICGRYLRNPVASILNEGDDMHFIPLYRSSSTVQEFCK